MSGWGCGEMALVVPGVDWGLAAYAAERSLSDRSDPAAGRAGWARWSRLADDDEATIGLALASIGMDRERLCELLGGPPVGAVEAPGWVSFAERLRRAGAGEPVDPREFGLLTVAADLVRGAQVELTRRLDAMRVSGGWPGELDGLTEILCGSWPRDELNMAVHRTMVLELNVARERGELHGESPEARYGDYLRRLANGEVRDRIWAEYPVLLRYCVERLDFWIDGSVEMASRLIADFTALSALLGRLGPLSAIRFGTGDRHRGGRAVAVLTFGEGRVVYKPRSLRVERCWGRVVDWFNRQAPARTLATAPVLVRQDYGWAGFVSTRPCSDESELHDFYWRIGALTALLHALTAIDINVENVLASGPQPVPVDLETLLHGANTPQPPSIDAAFDPAGEMLARGVPRIGLLPGRTVVRVNGGAHSFDYGVVGLTGEVVTPIPVPVTERPGTDHPRVVARHVSFPAGFQRVSLNQVPPDPTRHADLVVDGFTWTYRAILADREHWRTTLLAQFAGVPTRFLPQATSFYGNLLLDSLHPDFLRDALERERSLIRLARHVADPTRTPPGLPGSELVALRRGDIPYLESRPDSVDLVGEDGELITGCLATTPLRAAQERLDELGEPDLATQTRLIRLAFDSLRAASNTAPPSRPLDPEPLDADEARDAAEALALELCRDAVRGPDGIGWPAVDHVDESVWHLTSAGLNLYSGRSGIGLFLSTMSGCGATAQVMDTALALAETTARCAVTQAERLNAEDRYGVRIRREIDRFPNAGVFGDVGGAVYYLSHAGILHRRDDFLDAAEALVPLLRRHIAADATFDVTGGCAGAILALIALYAVRPTPDALAAARYAAERLLTAAVRHGDGLGWPVPWRQRPQVGMAHGTAGIGYALARLHAIAPDPQLIAAITGVLRYEHDQFNPTTGNWPTPPPTETADQSYHEKPTWCYGSTGIGLARIGILREPALAETHHQARADLHLAVADADTKLFAPHGSGFNSNGQHGLCHGDLGNLELLALAAQATEDSPPLHPADPDPRIARAAQTIMRHVRTHGWLTGTHNPRATPGLMHGTAGIGYGLLRMTHPRQVPSVLLLEPPQRATPQDRTTTRRYGRSARPPRPL